MTYRELEDLISKITYKPGYHLSCLRDAEVNSVCIRISNKTLDSDDEDQTTVIFNKFHIFEEALGAIKLEDLLLLVRSNVRSFELHEVDEWLKFDGTHLKDPHPEIKKK